MPTKPQAETEDGYIDLGKTPETPKVIELTSDGESDDGEDDDGDQQNEKTYYPSFYICSDKQLNLGAVGASGEATIKYTVDEYSERSRDGETMYHYDLKVTSIKPLTKVANKEVDALVDESAGFKESWKKMSAGKMGENE
jgi:hypothetical protein